MIKQESNGLLRAAGTYRDLLLARGDTPKHAADTFRRIRDVVQVTQARTLRQLRPTAVQIAIGNLPDVSLATKNHYVRALRSFGRWLAGETRCGVNPLLGLRSYHADSDPRHPRRALSERELAKLIATAALGPVVRRMCGVDRAWLYLLAACTGLRAGELRQLTRPDFDLAGETPTPPAVIVRASVSKNRRTVRQPIPRSLAAGLRRWLAARPAKGPVFNMPQPSRVVHMLRADLRRAGIEYIDAAGSFADFHSLRHTFITRTVRVCQDLKVVQDLARHSTIKLTIDRYAHVSTDERHRAVNRLAVWRPVRVGRAGIEPATHGFSVHVP